MTRNSIRAEVWRLILIPALSITLLLTGILSYLYLAQLDNFVETRGQALATKTARLLQQPLAQGQLDRVQDILDLSIEEPYIRALRLYPAAGQPPLHAGPMGLADGELPTAGRSAPFVRSGRQTLSFWQPLKGDTGGWLEVEILNAPYLLVRYQIILLTLAAASLCLLLAAVLAIRLHKNITEPLEHLNNVVRMLASGQLHARADRAKTNQSLEFSRLADSVNAMATSVEERRQDMQTYLEQSTEDLRETLETIEVQNIELNLARKNALAASRIKSEFLANTSHEIRTPLNGILGFTNLALKTNLDEQQREYLNTIRDSSHNLLTIINDILDFSKIEAGKLKLDYHPLPLRRTLEETIHMLGPNAHEKNLQLIAMIDPKIPGHLLGDQLRLKQVVTNLISNAIKFSDKGNITIQAELVSKEENQVEIRISVTDRGIGLSREEQAQLFNAFSQVDNSSSRKHGGTGLGLAICKGLVERMGGQIGVESKPGEGARFWFTARFGLDIQYNNQQSQPVLRDHRILLCSDNEESRQQLQSLLELWQARHASINALHDTFLALREALARQEPVDLVILDVAPEDRNIKADLLHSLGKQLQEEFSCKLMVCCTPAHQRLFRSESSSSLISYVNKPATSDNLLQVLAKELDIPSRDLRSVREPPATPEPESGLTVLLVDDNPANLQLAAELLRGLGVRAVQASSGQQALQLCAQQSFDLILMDIQMPGLSGIETTRQLRLQEDTGRRTPVIALTAHSLTEQKTELLIAGMDDCIRKPVSESQLQHIIRRWTQSSAPKVPRPGLVETISEVHSDPAPEPIDLAPGASTKDRQKNPAKQASPTPIDVPLSLQLANNKPSLARDMLIMLLQNLPSEQKLINTSYRKKDYAALEALVHKLYGSCCYCGVPYLKCISVLVDKLLQNNQFDQLDAPMETLNSAINDIMKWAYQRDINALFGINVSH